MIIIKIILMQMAKNNPVAEMCRQSNYSRYLLRSYLIKSERNKIACNLLRIIVNFEFLVTQRRFQATCVMQSLTFALIFLRQSFISFLSLYSALNLLQLFSFTHVWDTLYREFFAEFR